MGYPVKICEIFHYLGHESEQKLRRILSTCWRSLFSQSKHYISEGEAAQIWRNPWNLHWPNNIKSKG